MLRALQSRAGPAVVAACAVAMPAVMWSHGSFASTAGLPAAADREAIANSRPNPALNPNEFRSFKLAHKEQLTHDTARYTFALPRASDELGLTIASCLVVQAEIDGASKYTLSHYFVCRPWCALTEERDTATTHARRPV